MDQNNTQQQQQHCAICKKVIDKSYRNTRAKEKNYCFDCDYELALQNEYYAKQEDAISDADWMY
jgi:hypothetical protein